MKPVAQLAAAVLVPAAIALIAAPAPVWSQSNPPAHSATVARPVDKVFATVKEYLGDPFTSDYQLVSADAKTHTIVATQSTSELGTWSGWSYCVATPMEMFGGGFQDGIARVTVKLGPAAKDKNSTLVSVAVDFRATFHSGPRVDRVQCGSKGRLEATVLSAAAAGP